MPGRYPVHPLGQAALALGLALSALSSGQAAVAALKAVPSDRPSVIDSGAAKPVGALDPSRIIALTLTLPLTHQADLDRFARDVSNPTSPLYGQYLTPEQLAANYGASQSDYDALLTWAKASGLNVTQTSISRMTLSLSAPAERVQKAFGVRFNNYVDSDGKNFFSASNAPQMPAALAGMVHAVYGMSSYAPGEPMNVYIPPAKRAEIKMAQALGVGKAGPDLVGRGRPSDGNGHEGAFSPYDLNKAYQMPQVGSRGKGQALGFYAEGGIYTSDATVYENYYHLPKVPVIPVSVAGADTTIPVAGVASEASLDMDMEIAMAPHTPTLYCYEDTNPNFSGSLIEALTKVADDDKISAFDISYGLDEALQLSAGGPQGFADENTALEMAAAEGISVYASAGDNGAYGDLGEDFYPASYNVSDPASEPYVTGVGGTTMFFSDGVDFLEDTWGELPLAGATGGGISDIWNLPSYQKFFGGTAITAFNGGSAKYRNVPDVAAVGDPVTGVDVYTSDTYYIPAPGWLELGGTSASAPIWTGFTAVLNQQRHDAGLSNIGFANPLYYGIYDAVTDDVYGFNYPDSTVDFDEVSVGTNGNVNSYGSPGFTAGFGYDNTTGLGSLSAGVLMQDCLVLLPGLPGHNGTPSDAPTNFKVTATTPTSVSFTWKAAKYAKGYVLSYFANDNYYSDTSYPTPLSATTGTSATIASLKPKTAYTFILAAVNNTSGSYDTDDQPTVTTPAK